MTTLLKSPAEMTSSEAARLVDLVDRKIFGVEQTLYDDLLLRASSITGKAKELPMFEVCPCGCGREYYSGEAANVRAANALVDKYGPSLVSPTVWGAGNTAKVGVCVVCGKEFAALRATAKYCSAACSQKAKRTANLATHITVRGT